MTYTVVRFSWLAWTIPRSMRSKASLGRSPWTSILLDCACGLRAVGSQAVLMSLNSTKGYKQAYKQSTALQPFRVAFARQHPYLVSELLDGGRPSFFPDVLPISVLHLDEPSAFLHLAPSAVVHQHGSRACLVCGWTGQRYRLDRT